MPVVLTFDLNSDHTAANDHAYLKSAFHRLGWQSIGSTAYRYPRLGTLGQPVEDWLNHVIPALMLFRAYCAAKPLAVDDFSLEVHSSSSGYVPAQNARPGHGIEARPEYGRKAQSDQQIHLYPSPPPHHHYGEANLRNWIDNIRWEPVLHDN
jgi:hypothetical protein